MQFFIKLTVLCGVCIWKLASNYHDLQIKTYLKMETRGKVYEPIFIPSQFCQKLARCSLFLLSFQKTQEDYIPILSCKLVGAT